MRPHSKTARGGFTAVELMISLTLLVGVLGSLAVAMGRGISIFHDSGVQLEVRSRAQRALERASRELLGTVGSTLTPTLSSSGVPPLPWTSSLGFARSTSWDPAGPTLTGPLRLLFEPDAGETDDGTDEDGDGLIDEHRLVLVVDEGLPGEERVTVATGLAELLEGEVLNGADDNGNGLVDEQGFCVFREGGMLILQVTAMKAVQGSAVERHTERVGVGIRNQ